ncbi:MAG: UDP-N-acetylglucosamine 2-epimerase [Candidatus Hodarchaeales archaeon]|jgi:UDP-hydrolysing UDP-N-acetyl-D-glucosamine 2-epimerase
MTKIAIITGSRSEYGILRNLMKAIDNDDDLDLILLVTGMHLSPEFGLTKKEIIKDGFKPTSEVEMLLSSDTKIGIAKSIALGIDGISEALTRIKPDFTIILGDRFEMLAAAIATIHSDSILVHISGGDVASGMFDDYYRNSITKMAQIHFVSTPLSMQRVLLMGSNPEHVLLTGSLSYDEILHGIFQSREQVSKVIGLNSSKSWCLAVYHPTINEEESLEEFKEMISALKSAIAEYDLQVILIYPNADVGGRMLIEKIKDIEGSDWIVRVNLPREIYITLLKESTFIIGNSSSGIVEAAAISLPSINIGLRQKDRERSECTIDIEGDSAEIFDIIKKIMTDQNFVRNLRAKFSPYGDGHASARILEKIKVLSNRKEEYPSHFIDNSEAVISLKKVNKVPYSKFKEKALTAEELLSLIKMNE